MSAPASAPAIFRVSVSDMQNSSWPYRWSWLTDTDKLRTKLTHCVRVVVLSITSGGSESSCLLSPFRRQEALEGGLQ